MVKWPTDRRATVNPRGPLPGMLHLALSSLCSFLLQRVLGKKTFRRSLFVERLPDWLMFQVSRHKASEANLSAARTHCTTCHFNSGEIETAFLSPLSTLLVHPKTCTFCVVEEPGQPSVHAILLNWRGDGF